jgi:trk system potassium uptake protein TrkH
MPLAERWHRLQLHSKLVLFGTLILLLIGSGRFLILEWNHLLREMPVGEKLLVATFYSATTRTAGFSTVDVAELNPALK